MIMKIKHLTVALGCSFIILTSCMKEYDCTCDHVVTQGSQMDSTWTTETTVTNDNKKDAQANCEYLGGTNYSGQTVIEETCTLK